MLRRVVIIGGGITGLSTAFRLKQQAEQNHLSITCTVLEESHRLGGKIRTNRNEGFVLETGPDSLLARRPAGIQLIRDLGIESEVIQSNDAAMGTCVLHKGQLVPMPKGTNMGIPASPAAWLSNPLVSRAGKLRALQELMLPPVQIDGDISVGQFLTSRFGEEWVRLMCEPLLAGIHAADLKELSLSATYPHLLQLGTNHRSLILASAKMRRGLKPAVKSSGRSAFVTLKDGLQTLIERLYDCLHDWADLQTQTHACSVARSTNQSYQIECTQRGRRVTLEADAVVITTPANVAADLLTDAAPVAAVQLQSIPYVSTATVILGFDNQRLQQPITGSGFLVPRDESQFITACTYMSNKWPHTTPQGFTVVRCYVGRRGEEEVLSLNDTDLVQAVQQEFAAITHIDTEPSFTRLTRWDRAMPQYTVGHTERIANAEQVLKQLLPGVFIAGGAYHGVGIPDCIGQAQRAAQSVLSALQVP